jgi:hypothetical protein
VKSGGRYADAYRMIVESEMVPKFMKGGLREALDSEV